ncbi:MAG: nucleoside-triphosphatase [Clostridiales Family XIII bacterium]|jgi:nucleoside-triphosphatase|nr:nucleoside-triphosphatase [Clostridiales Family XIII bacterium]
MHLFLTGDIQVGKSTIIGKVVARLGLAPAGFRTVWDAPDQKGLERLYILPFGGAGDSPCQASAHGGREREDGRDGMCDLARHGVKPAAVRRSGGRMLEIYPEVFDDTGVRILADEAAARRARIVVMDELGFIESGASAFQSAVLERLDGDIPVLGVIKPRRTTFLDEVRARGSVRIMEVTPKNRDALAAEAIAHVRDALSACKK